MTKFAKIRARAAKRKGGDAALEALLARPDPATLAQKSDDRFLSQMAKCIFRSGFVWRVVDQKWPAFEEAFLGFDPARLTFEHDEFWHRLAADERIVRNATKIRAVRDNANFVRGVAAEHGSFGRFLAAWPASDQIGLLALLAKRGTRLGGMTGQYFLRFAGWDAFLLSRDVVTALRDAGLEIAATPTSKGDMRKVQDQFNAWRAETGLSNEELSRTLAMSAGDNYDTAEIAARSERAAS